MKINGQVVNGKYVAYDNCHKIYIIETFKDMQQAKKIGYSIYNIEDIEDIYEYSCELRFISNWKLDKQYVKQFEDMIIEKE